VPAYADAGEAPPAHVSTRVRAGRRRDRDRGRDRRRGLTPATQRDTASALDANDAASGDNEAKGGDGPEQWKPPNRSEWCAYALVWDQIRAKWRLTATPVEWNTLVAITASG